MNTTILVVIVVVLLLVWGAAHRQGKREGSRKGYGVGFDRGRRSKGKNGCLVILASAVATLALTGLSTVAVYSWWLGV